MGRRVKGRSARNGYGHIVAPKRKKRPPGPLAGRPRRRGPQHFTCSLRHARRPGCVARGASAISAVARWSNACKPSRTTSREMQLAGFGDLLRAAARGEIGARSGTGARRRRHDRNVDRGSNLRRAADAPFGHSRVAPRASDDASCRLNHPFSGCNDSLEQHRSADARPPRPSTHLTSTRCRSTCRRRRVARSSATRRSRARRSRTRASAFRSAVCAGLRPIPRTGARVSARARSRRRRANAAPRRLAAIRKERVERSSPSPAPAGRKKAAASQRPSTAGRKKSAVRKLPARRFSTPGETRTDRLPVRVPGCAYCCAAAARSFDTSFSLIRADLPERSRR